MTKLIFWIVILTALVNVIHVKRSRVLKQPDTPRNNIIFERIEYEAFNKNLFYDEIVFFKPIAPNVLKINFTIVIPSPKVFHELWLQVDFNYKYNSYQKFPIATVAELCSFFDGKTKNQVIQLIRDNLQHDFILNFEQRCPLAGTLSITADRYNFSNINLPLIPAGRYRCDFQFLPRKTAKSIFSVQFYFRVSDLRIWF